MTQRYTTIDGSKSISTTWPYIGTNDLTIMSNSSGTAFPTTNLEIGMFCYRTDEKKNYQLTGYDTTGGGNEPVWEVVVDGNADIDNAFVPKGSINTAFNFNEKTEGGMFNVYLGTWSGCSNYPGATNATGLLSVYLAGSVILQEYTDTILRTTFRRTFTGSQWTGWVKNWDSASLTGLHQLSNTTSGFITSVSSSAVNNACGGTPWLTAHVNTETTSPEWNTSIPMATTVNGSGNLKIGRTITFYGNGATDASTVVLDAGSSGSTTLNLTGAFVASGDVSAYSDKRLKTDIKVIDNAIDKVKQIRGVTFQRVDLPDDAPRQTGVIAQEVQKVLPEAVKSSLKPDVEKEFLCVSYGNMVGLLIEAIKEQQKQIESMQKEIDSLK